MFMTTKTHERLLAECREKLENAALIERNANQDALDAERLVSANMRIRIVNMQHFYNKGRAVHAADVRYEAKKRAEKAWNKHFLAREVSS